MTTQTMPARRRRRWGDNDRHLGPFTFAFRETWKPFAAVASSGSTERENPGCCIRFQAFGATLICELPPIIKPWRKWVDLRGKEWANSDGYWDEHPREYGFCLSGGHLSVHLGAQTNDSSTEQRWGCFLPWTQWRQIAHRLYHADGSLAGDVATKKYPEWQQTKDAVRKARFAITDHDDEQIEVETYVEEREWRLGTGWFRWLGYVAPKKQRRSMDMHFNHEVGTEKGSWQGGVIGTGIEMLPDETQEQAMRRYCDEEHRSKHQKYRVKFVGAL